MLNNDFKKDYFDTSSFTSFLPSPFLTCCAILPTSFGGKGPHLRQSPVAQPLHQTVSQLRFSGVFLSFKANARAGDLCTVPRIISLSSLSLATDVTDATLGESWPLVGNPERSCWHRHTSLKLFWPQPIAPWTAGLTKYKTEM